MARTKNAIGPRGQVEKVNSLLVKKKPKKKKCTMTQRATIIVKSKCNSAADTVP